MAAKFGNFRVLAIPDRPLPKKIDLRPWMSEVENQEDLGSCTANAFAGVLEYLINRKYRQKIDVSRLFIYYNARRLQHEDRTIQDTGTTPYHSADALRKYGDCDEELWPYKGDLVNQRPSREAYEKAKQYTVVPVRMSFQMKSFKKSLAAGYPVILGVILLDSAGTEARMNGGRIDRPDASRTTVKNTQWHAVVCVGYDDATREFIVRNSWGKDWGLRGYFHLPYEYFDEKRLVDEANGAWTIYDILLRSDRLPTMIFAQEKKKEENRARHRHRPHRHAPDHAPSPSIYRRPVAGGLSPRYGAGPVLPYHSIYHRH